MSYGHAICIDNDGLYRTCGFCRWYMIQCSHWLRRSYSDLPLRLWLKNSVKSVVQSYIISHFKADMKSYKNRKLRIYLYHVFVVEKCFFVYYILLTRYSQQTPIFVKLQNDTNVIWLQYGIKYFL